MEETCKIDNCMDKPKEDSGGYCPSHAPKPWWRSATDLVEDGKVDIEKEEAKKMEKRFHEVNG